MRAIMVAKSQRKRRNDKGRRSSEKEVLNTPTPYLKVWTAPDETASFNSSFEIVGPAVVVLTGLIGGDTDFRLGTLLSDGVGNCFLGLAATKTVLVAPLRFREDCESMDPAGLLERPLLDFCGDGLG